MSPAQPRTTRENRPSRAVVEAVAEADDADPVELTPPLYEVIDSDALDRLFTATTAHDRTDGQVTFSYNGYGVTVRGDGSVSVEEQDE